MKKNLATVQSIHDAETVSQSVDLAQKNQYDKKNKQTEERRRNDRKKLRFKLVFIASDNGVFRSYSEDISFGGILIEHDLPPSFLSSPIKIYITSLDGKYNIKIDAEVAASRNNPRCIQFLAGSSEALARLENWLGRVKTRRAA